MCIPKPQESAAPASTVPSQQAANNFQFGGNEEPRGAAMLGRLALRLTSAPGSAAASPLASATPAPPPPPAPVVSSAPAAPTTGGNNGVNSTGAAGSFVQGPNTALRIAKV